MRLFSNMATPRRDYRSSALLPLVAVILGGVLLTGCKATEKAADTAESAVEDVADAAASAFDGPRAYFSNVEDGATVPQIYEYQFAVENFEIEPVGDGMVHEGKGHFHVGVDTICLPADTVIPTADPWIHFGDGSSSIELDLAPGPHTLVLQMGDGEHRTLDEAGLCAVLSVTVAADADADSEV